LVRWIALALAAAALGLGCKWLAETRVTRWAGIYLAIFTAFAAVLGAFGFGLGFSWVILPLAALAALGAIGDLFIAQPHKGRFSRARAERKGVPQ
jgi:membrane protein YdbS with pleckstrin-like domain